MKHTILSMLCLFFVSIITAQEVTNISDGDLAFEADVIDFGQIEKGAHGERVFKFTNTGTEPVVITKVKSTCGCTVPSYTKTPILPGAEGEITVTYDTKRVGAFTKTMTVISNAKTQNKKLIIKGEVLKEDS